MSKFTFNSIVSLIIMFVGILLTSNVIVICGFLSANIWAAAGELAVYLKTKKENEHHEL